MSLVSKILQKKSVRLILYKVYKAILHAIAFSVGRNTYKKVVVVGRARTGSNLLLSYLNSHRNIEMEGELFGYLKGKNCKGIWDSAFVRHVPWVKWFGFKIFYEQPLDSTDKEVWDLIEGDKEILIIHLKRSNILRSYLSHKIATKSGRWTQSSSAGLEELESEKINIDIEDCVKDLQKTQLCESAIAVRFAQHQCYELTFEQLVNNPEEEMQKIFTAMHLKNRKIQTKMMKQNPESIKDIVLNYSALSTALAGTEYSHFLEE